MRTLALTGAGLAGILHVVFFLAESVWWRRPAVHRRFGVRSEEEVEAMAFPLYNQGFYNLGIGLGVLVGIALDIADNPSGTPVIVFGCAVMVLAAIVLVTARPRLATAAVIQGAPPLVALVGMVLA